MSRESQLSASISEATKERLDRFTESHGLKKTFVVEQALLFFMEARRELPDEALVPALRGDHFSLRRHRRTCLGDRNFLFRLGRDEHNRRRNEHLTFPHEIPVAET